MGSKGEKQGGIHAPVSYLTGQTRQDKLPRLEIPFLLPTPSQVGSASPVRSFSRDSSLGVQLNVTTAVHLVKYLLVFRYALDDPWFWALQAQGSSFPGSSLTGALSLSC